VTALDAARNYLARGYQPVPVPHGENGPRLKDRPNFRRLGGLVRGKQLTREQLSEMGRKGGKQRAKNLSAAERKRIAKLAVAARERLRKGSS
jgi:hypothetical protein